MYNCNVSCVTGFANEVNQAGINYYKNLIRELKNNNIEPLVTIFHWDLPQVLQDYGGFLNDSLKDWFVDYARVCFENFGEDVKMWITFNEATSICYSGYGTKRLAPALGISGVGEYICGHNLIKGHAAAYHLYDQEFRPKQGGKIVNN